jgi:hypothetical protein
MVARLIDYVSHNALDMGREVRQHGRGGLPSDVRLTVDQSVALARVREEPLRNVLLPVAEYVNRDRAAF